MPGSWTGNMWPLLLSVWNTLLKAATTQSLPLPFIQYLFQSLTHMLIVRSHLHPNDFTLPFYPSSHPSIKLSVAHAPSSCLCVGVCWLFCLRVCLRLFMKIIIRYQSVGSEEFLFDLLQARHMCNPWKHIGILNNEEIQRRKAE